MNLNSRLQVKQFARSNLPLVLIHGLFGSLDNLGVLARGLKHDRQLIQLDVRNHGASPWADAMTYTLMAQDVLNTLDRLQVDRFSIIGHSMGGKIAMNITAIAPDRVDKIVVIDIAPVAYATRRHDNIFTALYAVNNADVTRRSDAAMIMRQYLIEDRLILFLLKSFHEGKWCFNVPILWKYYPAIIGWQPQPAWLGQALFIRGNHSSYLSDNYRDVLLAQFPAAYVHMIAGAGHWVHAEKPDAVLRIIRHFFAL